MKSIRRIIAGILACAGFALLLNLLHAQVRTDPVQNGPLSLTAADMAQLPDLSDEELAAFLSALTAMPMINAGDLPETASTFHSLAHPDWPPLPTSFGLPLWNLGSDFYLLNDLQRPTFSNGGGGGLQAMNMDPNDPGDGGANYSQPNFQPLILTTNDLWLEITGTTNPTGTNVTASLVIHPPWNVTNGIYDLFNTTNLATPHGWSWILRGAPGQTNLIVTNLTSDREFFILGLTNDTDTDFLSDAFELLVSGSSPTNVDTDGDGWTDADEFLMGTDSTTSDLPHPSFSVTALVSPASESGTNGQFLITRSVKLTNAVYPQFCCGDTIENSILHSRHGNARL